MQTRSASSSIQSPSRSVTSLDIDTEVKIAQFITEGIEDIVSFKDYCSSRNNKHYFGSNLAYLEKCRQKLKYFRKIKSVQPELWTKNLQRLGLVPAPPTVSSPLPTSHSLSQHEANVPRTTPNRVPPSPSTPFATMSSLVKTEDGNWAHEYDLSIDDQSKNPDGIIAYYEPNVKFDNFQRCGKVVIHFPIRDIADYNQGLVTAKLSQDGTKLFLSHPIITGSFAKTVQKNRGQLFIERSKVLKAKQTTSNDTVSYAQDVDALEALVHNVKKSGNNSIKVLKAPRKFVFSNKHFNADVGAYSRDVEIKREGNPGSEKNHPIQITGIVELMVEGSIQQIRHRADSVNVDDDFLAQVADVAFDGNTVFVSGDRDTRGIDAPTVADNSKNDEKDQSSARRTTGDDGDLGSDPPNTAASGRPRKKPAKEATTPKAKKTSILDEGRKSQFKPLIDQGSATDFSIVVGKAKRAEKVNQRRGISTADIGSTGLLPVRLDGAPNAMNHASAASNQQLHTIVSGDDVSMGSIENDMMATMHGVHESADSQKLLEGGAYYLPDGDDPEFV